MKKIDTRIIAFSGVFIALITMLAQIPMLGFIPLPWTFLGISVGATTVHAIVIAGSLFIYTIEKDLKKGIIIGLVLGLAFGINSFIVAWVRPTSFVEEIFRNPLISILPRVLFGISIIPIFTLCQKILNNENLSAVITAIITTLIHTFLVIIPLYIIGGGNSIFGEFFDVIYVTVIGNSIAEVILAIVLVAPIYSRVSRAIGE